jgi:hypothetical protein
MLKNWEEINKYPLSGFSKISWEEFCGMLHVLQLYNRLGNEQKEIIDLMMLGMQKREEMKGNRNPLAAKPPIASEACHSSEAAMQSKGLYLDLSLNESYKKGDIVKIIANDEYFGTLCKIYEKCVDSTRKDLYAVVPIPGQINFGQKIYAGCSL